jgi:hypothetical protein
MELIHGYGWVLSAVIIAGWALSWWTRRWVRWTVLCIAEVACVLCVAYGYADGWQPISESQLHCLHVVECLNLHPLGWINNGIVGLTCSLVLMLVTGAVELVIVYKPRSSAE